MELSLSKHHVAQFQRRQREEQTGSVISCR